MPPLKRLAPLPIAFAASALWILFGPFAAYPPLSYVDPWFYAGYFTNFPFLLLQGGFSYYVSRLPWIIPGLIAFRIAPPALATLLLYTGVMGVSVACVYWIVRWHYERAPAILAAVLFATNPYFVASVVWLYPDGSAIAYGMIALALFLRPHGSRAWNVVLGASALTLSGLANMSGAPMVVGVAMIPLWQSRGVIRELTRDAIRIAAGATATTAVMMLASRILLGNWLVFMPQIDQWLYSVRNPSWLHQMWGTEPYLAGATRLFLPLVVLAWGALHLRFRKASQASSAAYVAALVCCALYAFQEFVLNSVVLRVAYHSVYLVAPVLTFAGIAIGEMMRNAKRSRMIAMGAAGTGLPLLFNQLGVIHTDPRIWIVFACLATATILTRGAIACLLLLIAGFAGPALDPRLGTIWSHESLLHPPSVNAGLRAADFDWMMRAQSWVAPRIDRTSRVRVWWDDFGNKSTPFHTFAAMYIDENGVIPKAFSDHCGSALWDIVGERANLIYFTRRPDGPADVRAHIAACGFTPRQELHTTIPLAGKDVFVTLFQIHSHSPQ